MPAAIQVDKEQVRMLVLSVGVREAARKMGLNEKTVLHWSHTGDWLKDCRPTPAIPAKLPPPASMTPSVNSVKPADALEDTLLSDGQATKVATMRFARKSAEYAANLAETDPEKALGHASDVKALAGAAQIVGGWAAGQTAGVRIAIFTGVADAPVIDV